MKRDTFTPLQFSGKMYYNCDKNKLKSVTIYMLWLSNNVK